MPRQPVEKSGEKYTTVAMSAVATCIRPRAVVMRPLSIANNGLRRYYSTPAKAPLPLEGYRVLDMTRVLAGVSPNPTSRVATSTHVRQLD